MNVNDFKIELPEGDMLELLFAKQTELMNNYHSIEEKNLGHELPKAPVDINDAKAQHRLKDYAWRVTEEIGEAMNCLKNKPWKQAQMVTDEVHFDEELVDGLHFYLELLLLRGFTARSLAQLYLSKSAVNDFRIRSKY